MKDLFICFCLFIICVCVHVVLRKYYIFLCLFPRLGMYLWYLVMFCLLQYCCCNFCYFSFVILFYLFPFFCFNAGNWSLAEVIDVALVYWLCCENRFTNLSLTFVHRTYHNPDHVHFWIRWTYPIHSCLNLVKTEKYLLQCLLQKLPVIAKYIQSTICFSGSASFKKLKYWKQCKKESDLSLKKWDVKKHI